MGFSSPALLCPLWGVCERWHSGWEAVLEERKGKGFPEVEEDKGFLLPEGRHIPGVDQVSWDWCRVCVCCGGKGWLEGGGGQCSCDLSSGWVRYPSSSASIGLFLGQPSLSGAR